MQQDGFHIIETVIVLLVAGVIGFGAYRVYQNQNKPDKDQSAQTTQSTPTADNSPPVWAYHEQNLEWFVQSGTAPKCRDPFVLDMSPVDISKVTAVGLPGAYRGFSYKAHGGFRLQDNTAGKIEVKAPIDGNLRGVTRYYEAMPGYPHELQYIVDFESDCGMAFRFDHLYKLTPKFQAVAEKSPLPKKDDTRRNPSTERISIPVKAGEVIATVVGMPSARNYGFDFGMYDYRQRNQISRNAQWAAIHRPFSAQTFHGVCWLHYLPGNDAAQTIAMAKDRKNYNSNKPFNLTSDYCSFAPHTTLDFNNGQPTDG